MEGNERLLRARVACLALTLLIPVERVCLARPPVAVQAFTRTISGSVLVDVRLNGTGPYRFLLDTGSSHSAVSATLAARLGVPRVAKTQVSTVGGTAWAAVVRIDALEWGPVRTTGVLATELDQERLDPGGDILGVLGRDVIGVQTVAIDYRRQVIEWPADPVVSGAPLEIDPVTGLCVVVMRQGGGTVRLVPDSGSEGLVLYERPGHVLPAFELRAGRAAVSTLAGGVTARRAVVQELRLGHAVLVNEPAVILDGSRVDAAHGDGLLPLHRFDRVVFDAEHGRMAFESRIQP